MEKDDEKIQDIDMETDHITVKVESFEDIRKANEEREEGFNALRAAMHSGKYQPTAAEEMNLTKGPNDDSHYWS